jgi:hypothetical protein
MKTIMKNFSGYDQNFLVADITEYARYQNYEIISFSVIRKAGSSANNDFYTYTVLFKTNGANQTAQAVTKQS